MSGTNGDGLTGMFGKKTPKEQVEIQIPAIRTFIVRKYDSDGDPVEINIDAHLVQPGETGMVTFIDLERGEEGPMMRVHRVIYHVEDVEEVVRMGTSKIITH